jgi:hypothetical protein
MAVSKYSIQGVSYVGSQQNGKVIIAGDLLGEGLCLYGGDPDDKSSRAPLPLCLQRTLLVATEGRHRLVQYTIDVHDGALVVQQQHECAWCSLEIMHAANHRRGLRVPSATRQSCP